MEAMHDVLEGDELDKVLDDCSKKPPCIYGANINDLNSPSFWALNTPYNVDHTKYTNQH